MADYKKLYRDIYASFGKPLTDATAMNGSIVDAASARLGIQVPAALRDFYLVAGRERRFTQAHNRFIAPNKWSIDRQRLIFLEENQWVVYWGVSLRSPSNEDPSVSQGINNEPIEWYLEHRHCSVFISVELHWQAVSGGMKHRQSAAPPPATRKKLDKNWTFVGEVNNMRAYHRAGQVVCLCPDFGMMSLKFGATSKKNLDAIGTDLELTWC